MGIRMPNQSDSKWNWMNTVFLCSFLEVTIVRCAFLIFEAKTDIEYGFSFYTFITGMACTAANFICIWMKLKMFNILQSFEKFVEKSKIENRFIQICNERIRSTLTFFKSSDIPQGLRSHREICMKN